MHHPASVLHSQRVVRPSSTAPCVYHAATHHPEHQNNMFCSGPHIPLSVQLAQSPLKKRVSPSLPTPHNISHYSSPSSSKNAPLRSRPPSAAFFALMINGTSTITKMPTTNVTKIMVILIFLHLICFLRSLLFF
mmetsp:Transcript_22858/g.55113  ORF Transcript_22858/g.55113 Transcript_22858/m.55113 type:complete len:134 (-) Transcript_22858:426-827(-)